MCVLVCTCVCVSTCMCMYMHVYVCVDVCIRIYKNLRVREHNLSIMQCMGKTFSESKLCLTMIGTK